MANSKIKALADELGLQYRDSLIYGVSNGYAVSIYDQKDCKVLFIDARLDDSRQLQKDTVRRFISESSKQYSIRSSAISQVGIKIAFTKKISVLDNLRDFYFAFLIFLETSGVGGISTCANCRKEISGDPVLVSVAGAAHACDSECAHKLVKSGADNIRTAARNSVLLGGLGAFIGAALGSCGYVAISSFGIFALWAGALIAIGAKLGYYAFGGTGAASDRAFSAVFSVLGILASQFLCEGLSVSYAWKTKGYIFAVHEPFVAALKSIVRNVDVLLPYLKSCAIAAAFALLTLVILSGVVKREPVSLPTVEILPKK